MCFWVITHAWRINVHHRQVFKLQVHNSGFTSVGVHAKYSLCGFTFRKNCYSSIPHSSFVVVRLGPVDVQVLITMFPAPGIEIR